MRPAQGAALAALALGLVVSAVPPPVHGASLGVYYGSAIDGAITRSVTATETVAVIEATTFTINAGVVDTIKSDGIAVYYAVPGVAPWAGATVPSLAAAVAAYLLLDRRDL